MEKQEKRKIIKSVAIFYKRYYNIVTEEKNMNVVIEDESKKNKRLKILYILHINTFCYHNTLIHSSIIFIYNIEHFKFYRYLSILILAQCLNRYTNKFYKNTANL